MEERAHKKIASKFWTANGSNIIIQPAAWTWSDTAELYLETEGTERWPRMRRDSRMSW